MACACENERLSTFISLLTLSALVLCFESRVTAHCQLLFRDFELERDML